MQTVEENDSFSIKEDTEDIIETLSELTGYPDKMIEQVFRALGLYLNESVSDRVIEMDYKPNSIGMTIPYIGEVVFKRDLLFKDTPDYFEFHPTDEFYEQFRKAFYYGDTVMLNIIKNNVEMDIEKFAENDLLRLEELL